MLGLILHAVVDTAGIQDPDGGVLVMATLFGLFQFLRKLHAKGGYQGPRFQPALKQVLRGVDVQIGERTIAWPNRCRRLAKDWENLNQTALAFLRWAPIRLLGRELCVIKA